eukprot:9636_1
MAQPLQDNQFESDASKQAINPADANPQLNKQSIFDSDLDEDEGSDTSSTSSSSQSIGDHHPPNPVPHLRPNSIHHKVEPSPPRNQSEASHNVNHTDAKTTLLKMGYPSDLVQHLLDRLSPSSKTDIPTLVEEMEKILQENEQKTDVLPPHMHLRGPSTPPPQGTDAKSNPYLDSQVMNLQQQQFSPKHNETFVASHDHSGNELGENHQDSDDDDETSSSSSQQIEEEQEEIVQVIPGNANDNNNDGNEVYDYDEDDDELPLDDMLPNCVKQLFQLISAKSDVPAIVNVMDKYNVLIRSNDNASEEENDWNDFRCINDEEEDGVTLLEHAFNVEHYAFCSYLLNDLSLLPFIYCQHIIKKLIQRIVNSLKANTSNINIQSIYGDIMQSGIKTLKPPTDGTFKDSFDVLKDLLVNAYKFQSPFLCKMIKDLLEETLTDEACFVDSLRDKFSEILRIVRQNGSECKDDYKREVWSMLFDCIIYRKRHMEWITVETKQWKEWIFKDWQIFDVILTKIDRFDEEYKKSNPHDAPDIRSLLWVIMNCMDDHKPNTKGATLICNYIYRYKDNESFSNFIDTQLVDTILQIVCHESFGKKAKQKYISILYYFFIDAQNSAVEKAIIKKCIMENDENAKKLVKMLYHLFVMKMLRVSKGPKVTLADCYEQVKEEHKKVTKEFEEIKTDHDITLKHVIQYIIGQCLSVCKSAKRSSFFMEQHCNVIILFAVKLSTFVPRILNKMRITTQQIISQIFTDVEQDSDEQHCAAAHSLQTFMYQKLPNSFNTKTLTNVHVLVLMESQPSTAFNEEKAEELNDKEGKNMVHIHLMNVSIVNGMKIQQIQRMIHSCLRVRYFTNTAYNAPHKKGDTWHYKTWNKSKWKAARSNDSLHQNKKGDACVLLMTNDETMNVHLHTLLAHIHRYALMSLRAGDEVFYFDQDEVGKKRDIWLRGKVTQVAQDKDKQTIQMIAIENNDSKDRMFANHSNDTKYLCDVFDARNHCFSTSIPSQLTQWLPVSYYKPRDIDCKWQAPTFRFIASMLTSPISELFRGFIKHRGEDKYRGAINVIAGDIPYPPEQDEFKLPPKLEIASEFDFNRFIEQHADKINDVNPHGHGTKYAWAVYVRWNDESMHDLLLADIDKKVHCIEYTNNHKTCTMFLLTAQHIQRISKVKSINFDFLRHGRDAVCEGNVFILTIFEGNWKHYSSLLPERFGCVYLKDLHQLCPQDRAYPFPEYPIRAKKKKKKDDKQKNKHIPSYSKQQRKQKQKKEAKTLPKDWDKAMRLIKVWAKKNKNSIPRDTAAWESVIKSQIIKDLYPNFKGAQDVEQLAIRAAGIDVEQFNVPDSPHKSSMSHSRPPSHASSVGEPPYHSPPHVKNQSPPSYPPHKQVQQQYPPSYPPHKQVQQEPPKYQPRPQPPQRYPQQSPQKSSSPVQQPAYHPRKPPRKHKQNQQMNNNNSFVEPRPAIHPAQVEPKPVIPPSDNPQRDPMSQSNVNKKKIDLSLDNDIPIYMVKPVVIDKQLQAHEIILHIKHGFLIAGPKDPDNVKDQFESIIQQCNDFALPISTARLLYVHNHSDLEMHIENDGTRITGDTLCLNLRMSSREYAASCWQMLQSLSQFSLKIPIQKLSKGDKRGMRFYVQAKAYTEEEEKELDELQLHSIAARRNFTHTAEHIIEIGERFKDNRLIQDCFLNQHADAMKDYSVTQRYWEKLPPKEIIKKKLKPHSAERRGNGMNGPRHVPQQQQQQQPAPQSVPQSVEDNEPEYVPPQPVKKEHNKNAYHEQNGSDHRKRNDAPNVMNNEQIEDNHWVEIQTQVQQLNEIDFASLIKNVNELMAENRMLKQRLSQYEDR